MRAILKRYAIPLLILDVGSDVAFYAYLWWSMS